MKIPRSNTGKLILAIIGGIGLIGLVLKIIMPPPTSITHSTLIDDPKSPSLSVNKIRYLGRELDFPENLDLVKVEQQVVIDLASRLAQSLSLEPLVGEENFWVSNQWNLVYDDKEQLLLLTNNLATKQTAKINQPEAIAQAQNWLEKLGLMNDLVANTESIEYLEGEYQLRKSSVGLADYIQIQFNYQISSYPLFVGTNSRSPYIVMLDSGGNLIKLIIYPQQVIKTQVESSKPTISIDGAVGNIKNKNLGLIIDDGGGLTDQKITNYEEIIFNRVKIEYRLETDGQTAIPYYRFSGVATDSNQKSTNLELITPAIDI